MSVEHIISTLPTYDQIRDWADGWVPLDVKGDPAPPRWFVSAKDQHSPWMTRSAGNGEDFVCVLLHHDGTRVEVVAPKEPMTQAQWCLWFGWILNRMRMANVFVGPEAALYREHVTWRPPENASASPHEHERPFGVTGGWSTNPSGGVTISGGRIGGGAGGVCAVCVGDTVRGGGNGSLGVGSTGGAGTQTSAGSGESATREDAVAPSGSVRASSPQSAEPETHWRSARNVDSLPSHGRAVQLRWTDGPGQLRLGLGHLVGREWHIIGKGKLFEDAVYFGTEVFSIYDPGCPLEWSELPITWTKLEPVPASSYREVAQAIFSVPFVFAALSVALGLTVTADIATRLGEAAGNGCKRILDKLEPHIERVSSLVDGDRR